MKKSRLIDRITSLFGKSSVYLADDHRILSIVDRIDGSKEWAIIHAGLDQLVYKGSGERVGILDTGVDTNHRDLVGRVVFSNFIPNSLNTDENGHGTFCAGEIIANGSEGGIIGVAPSANAFCCKVLYGDSRDGSVLDFEDNLNKAIRVCWQEGCGVLSMSIGFDHKSKFVEDALLEAVEHGVIPIAAAGNSGMMGSLNKSYPAAYKCCISVASANEKGMPAWFSSTGVSGEIEEQPEIAVASREYYWGSIPGNRYGKMIGTSMACPIIAGTALLWREAMKKKNQLPLGSEVLKEFREWLKSIAKDTNLNGWDSSLGYGILSLKAGDL